MGKRQRKRQRQQPLSPSRSTQAAHDRALSPLRVGLTDSPSLSELMQLVDEQRRLSERQRTLVAELVAAGTGWPQIAPALGVSRQAARQQFLRTHASLADSG